MVQDFIFQFITPPSRADRVRDKELIQNTYLSYQLIKKKSFFLSAVHKLD